VVLILFLVITLLFDCTFESNDVELIEYHDNDVRI